MGGQKLIIPWSALKRSNITLKLQTGNPYQFLEVIPVDVTVRGSKRNTSRQPLHVENELSTLFISKICLQELGIISDSFPLPEKVQ